MGKLAGKLLLLWTCNYRDHFIHHFFRKTNLGAHIKKGAWIFQFLILFWAGWMLVHHSMRQAMISEVARKFRMLKFLFNERSMQVGHLFETCWTDYKMVDGETAPEQAFVP